VESGRDVATIQTSREKGHGARLTGSARARAQETAGAQGVWRSRQGPNRRNVPRALPEPDRLRRLPNGVTRGRQLRAVRATVDLPLHSPGQRTLSGPVVPESQG
jgi:hypothetical protein